MSKGAPSHRQMARLERMLERCIEGDKAANRKRRQQGDPFYQKVQQLRELQN